MTPPKPSHEEEEYFARQEILTKRALAEKIREESEKEELENMKKLHWMHCAKCGFQMHPVVFKGITIEKCPNCNGIFLDEGELEQLAGKESAFFTSVRGLFKF
jgi:hypothetical protein